MPSTAVLNPVVSQAVEALRDRILAALVPAKLMRAKGVVPIFDVPGLRFSVVVLRDLECIRYMQFDPYVGCGFDGFGFVPEYVVELVHQAGPEGGSDLRVGFGIKDGSTVVRVVSLAKGGLGLPIVRTLDTQEVADLNSYLEDPSRERRFALLRFTSLEEELLEAVLGAKRQLHSQDVLITSLHPGRLADWQGVYESGSFSINTFRPSILVEDYASKIRPASRVVDIGCGGGRNALYLASLGYRVEAYDLVDLDWIRKAPSELASRIQFSRQKAEDITLGSGGYGAVLMMRLIQYLPEREVERLIAKASSSLEKGGLLLISYGVSGGIHNTAQVDVEKYLHQPETIRAVLEGEGLAIHSLAVFDTVQQHVPYHGALRACELVAVRF